MDTIFEMLEAVEHWTVEEEDEAKEQKRNVFNDPKLKHLEGNYKELLKYLEKFPPDAKHYSEPLQDIGDPFTYTVHTEGHLRLRITARYEYWSQTCYIEKVLIDIRRDKPQK